MKLLAIETSTEACSAALLYGENVISRYEYAPLQHSQLILKFADTLLAQAGITLSQCNAIAFGRGPGSFTGVRIAASVVQGMSLAHNLPVVPISTLMALAYGLYRETGETHIMATLDARMQEIYAGYYEMVNGYPQLQGQERCGQAPFFITPTVAAPWVGVGTGCSHCSGLARVYPERYPHAEDIALLAKTAVAAGKGVGAECALPVYLRDEVVTMGERNG